MSVTNDYDEIKKMTRAKKILLIESMQTNL